MNRMCKILLSSLILSLCSASLSLSASATDLKKESSEQKSAATKQESSEQKSSATKQESSEQKSAVVEHNTSDQKESAAKAPSVFFPSPAFEFDSAVDGTDVIHDFVIMNRGRDTLQVKKVKTG